MTDNLEAGPSNEREEASLLIPWYVTGTLDAAEHVLVERRLDQSAELRDELALLRDVKEAVDLPEESLPPPSGHRLDALLRRIDAHEAERRSGTWEALSAYWDWLRDLMIPGPLPVRMVTALAAVAILAQSITLVALLVPTAGERDGYVTLSGPAETLGARHEVVLLALQGDAVESDIRALLAAVDGAIVDGPTTDGLYTVEIRRTLLTRADLDAVLETLRSRPDVVRFAEAGAR